jgi:hypothetical protein
VRSHLVRERQLVEAAAREFLEEQQRRRLQAEKSTLKVDVRRRCYARATGELMCLRISSWTFLRRRV